MIFCIQSSKGITQKKVFATGIIFPKKTSEISLLHALAFNSEEVKERNLTLVTEIGFSTSIVNALLRNKIQFVYQIELYTYKDLKRFRMIGVTSAIEIVEVLENKFNIKLQGYEDYLKDKQKLMSGKY